MFKIKDVLKKIRSDERIKWNLTMSLLFLGEQVPWIKIVLVVT